MSRLFYRANNPHDMNFTPFFFSFALSRVGINDPLALIHKPSRRFPGVSSHQTVHNSNHRLPVRRLAARRIHSDPPVPGAPWSQVEQMTQSVGGGQSNSAAGPAQGRKPDSEADGDNSQDSENKGG